MWLESDFQRMGIQKKNNWQPIPDYHPDCNPSSSAIKVRTEGSNVTFVVQVRGLGVMTLRSTTNSYNGKCILRGIGLFTKDEIGYSPEL